MKVIHNKNKWAEKVFELIKRHIAILNTMTSNRLLRLSMLVFGNSKTLKGFLMLKNQFVKMLILVSHFLELKIQIDLQNKTETGTECRNRNHKLELKYYQNQKRDAETAIETERQ